MRLEVFAAAVAGSEVLSKSDLFCRGVFSTMLSVSSLGSFSSFLEVRNCLSMLKLALSSESSIWVCYIGASSSTLEFLVSIFISFDSSSWSSCSLLSET